MATTITTSKFEEVLSAATKYFNGNTLAADIWAKKYALRDKDDNYVERTPADMHRRLAREFARIEANYPNPMTEDEIFGLFDQFRYVIPQGSPMFGVGNPYQVVSQSNCFAIATIDSYGGICRADERIAQISKRRGGVGIDISPIRPKGLPTNNAAHTTDGIVVFMQRFSNTSKEVAQHGRRGALMISCSVHHPEILNFIKSKLELAAITGANISVRLTDEFMQAVKEDKDYEVRWPVDSKKPTMKTMLSSKMVWDEIVKHAFLRAEPGVLFWDNIIKNSPADCYPEFGFKTVTTNPCITSDTWISTTKGPRRVDDLQGKQFLAIVDGSVYPSGKNGFFVTGHKPVYKVTTNKRFCFRCTEDHLVQTVDIVNRKQHREWTKASDLKIGSKIGLQDHRAHKGWDGAGTESEGWLLGSLVGDGVFSEETVVLSYWGETRQAMHKQAAEFSKEIGGRSDTGSGSQQSRGNVLLDKSDIKSKPTRDLAERFGVMPNKQFGDLVEKASSDFCRGFLRGWFDADGTVLLDDDKQSFAVRLASVRLDNLQRAQGMLARLGIIATLYPCRREAGYRMLPDGKGGYAPYFCQELHELHIGKSNMVVFAEKVGFSDPDKNEKLAKLLSSYDRGPYEEGYWDVVESIEPDGIELVYDCQIETIHCFDGNGVTLHNCSELPLAEGSSCILCVLNLCSYIDNPFTDHATFNFDLFCEHTRKAMRITDDLVDIEIESVDKIIAKVESDPEPSEVKANELALWQMVKEKCINGRRTGLGLTSIGDAIAMLGYRYGDDNSFKFVEQVYEALRNNAYRESVEMAKQRGKFPIHNAKNEDGHAFLSRLPADIVSDMKKHGRRNIALLTTAPAGTISNLARCSEGIFGTTSGFEPVFMASYTRKKKMSHNDTKEPDSIGEDGEKYKHFEVLHPGLQLFCQITGKKLEDSPYFGAQANDIPHDQRVRMQGAATYFVDHAISSTVNLGKDVEQSTIAEIYMTAWTHGCKGITVYREGSREGILVSKNDKSVNKAGCENCDDAAEKFKQLIKQGGRPGRIILSSAPKRPTNIECDVIRASVKGKQWVFLVGKLNNQPYEVFGGASEDLEIPKKFKTGWIVKDGKHLDRTMYDLVLGSIENDGKTTRMVINNIAKVFSDYEHATFSRILSLCLRHGVPIKYICEQLTKDPEDDFQSYNRALARVLKSYIEEGETSGLECPNCHTAHMVYKGGCPTCMVCGNSSCS